MNIELIDDPDDAPLASTLSELERAVIETSVTAQIASNELRAAFDADDNVVYDRAKEKHEQAVAERGRATRALVAARAAQSPPTDSKEDGFQ